MSIQSEAIGRAVRQVREGKKNLSQEALAKLAGIHRTHISSVERGRSNLRFLTFKKIADGLGVSMGELMRIAELYEKELKAAPSEAALGLGNAEMNPKLWRASLRKRAGARRSCANCNRRSSKGPCSTRSWCFRNGPRLSPRSAIAPLP